MGVSVTTAYASGRTTNTYGVLVTGVTNQTLTYDGDGNLLTDGAGHTHTWENGMLIGISNGMNITSFFYDGLGHRIQDIEYEDGDVQYHNSVYVWCGSELCEDRLGVGGSGALLVNDQFFPQGEREPYYSSNYYYTRDYLGSVREITDSSGVVRARYDYDPYGHQTTTQGTFEASFGYAGMYVHTFSGLYLTLFRAYNPDVGRWLNRDPIQEAGGINLYDYVGNNPINYVDPLGLVFVITGNHAPFDQALAYLWKDPTMRQLITDLNNSDTKYNISLNNNDNDSYDPTTKTVSWDPNSALRTPCGTQTPALGLGHEFGHADGSPSWHSILHSISNQQYDNDEERRVIVNIETPAAIDLGEGTRTDHGGSTFRVPTPISR